VTRGEQEIQHRYRTTDLDTCCSI